MYLTQDIIGPYSRIVYGKKYEAVKVLGRRHEMILVECGKYRFHVKADKLSDKLLTGDVAFIEPEPLKEQKINWQEPKKDIPTITEIKADKKGQISLF